MKFNNGKEKSTSKESLKSKRKQATKKNSHTAKKRRRRVALFAIEGVLLLVVLAFLFLTNMLNKINREEVDPLDVSINSVESGVAEAMEKYTNIAVFGVDSRDNTTLDKYTHADTNMIVSINNETGEIRLLSVYRDTYLNIKGDDEYNKLTQAYFNGGYQQSISTLNKNLDLNITHFATVNWKAVADAINILGGIDVEITKREFDYINGFITETVKATGVGSVHLKSAGMNHLDGIQAVAYARLRLMDTDYRRTERQRTVVTLAMEKAKNADIATLYNLVNTVFPQVLTSFTNAELINLAKDITKYHIGESTGFPFDKDSKIMGKKGDCVIPLGLKQNVYQLHTFLFDNETYTPSTTVSKIDQKIKDATGWGDPGTTVKATSSGKSSSTAAAANTTTEAVTEETSQTTAEESVTVTENSAAIDATETTGTVLEESETSPSSESSQVIDETMTAEEAVTEAAVPATNAEESADSIAE